MSTATTGRPVGDNEFPVLLRLPDLNAPTWAPLSATSPLANTAAFEASIQSLRMNATATAPPATPTTTIATTLPSAAKPLSPGTTVDVVAPSPSVEAPRPASTPRADRATRMERSPAPGQWTLIRQLATGGVLVGGLALTYLFVMGGGNEETPSHVPIASSTLEPPIIEPPPGMGGNTPVVVRPDSDTPNNDIREVGPPPDFSHSWDPAMDSHIKVVDNTRDSRKTPDQSGRDATVPQPPVVTPPPTPDLGSFQGRIGPNTSAATPTYPTTNPETFLYRPITNEPGADAARTARLNGSIAPAPRR